MRNIKSRKSSRRSKNLHQLDIFSSGRTSRFRFQKKALKRLLKKYSTKSRYISKNYYYYTFWALTLAWIYLVFFSSFFNIKEIHIYRKDGLSNIEQAYRSMDIFRFKKIYSVEDKDISSRLQKSQKSLKYITIRKKLPDSLEIYLESYKALFVLGGKLILENGSILEGSGLIKNTLPKLEIADTWESVKTLSYQNLQNIKKIWILLAENIQDFQISHRIYYVRQEEVIFLTRQWVMLIFDLTENSRHQTEKLGLYIQSLQDTQFSDYIYLDLRISGKVYACWKKNEYLCRSNMNKIYGETPSRLLKDQASFENQQ